MDPLRNECVWRGRGWGQGYQHSKTMFSTFAHVPGLEVFAPVSVSDAYYQTKKAIKSKEYFSRRAFSYQNIFASYKKRFNTH